MVIVQCSVPDCEFQSADVSEALAIALLSNHALAHQISAPRPQYSAVRGPKLERPKVDLGISVEEWNMFQRRWDVFKAGSGIDDASAPTQLFQCAGTDLGDSLLKANANATNETLPELMAAMRSLAVIPVATCVLRTELLQLHQERDEQVRAFAARVRGKAETCAFSTKCSCGLFADYTDHAIRDVIVNGLYDSDIRREVLGVADILQKPVNDVIALIENREMARNALPSSSLSAVSSFRRQNHPTPTPSATPYRSDQAKVANCLDCHTSFQIFTEGTRGWNTTPHQLCLTCYREQRRRKRQPRPQQARPPRNTPAAVQAIEVDSISQVAALHAEHPQQSCNPSRRRRPRAHTTHCTISRPPAPQLAHHIFTKHGWRKARLRAHPTVPLTISLAEPGHAGNRNRGNAQGIQAEVPAIADTGAQSDLWSLDSFLACGFSQEDLQPISLSLSAANRSPISIEGAFFAKLATQDPSGKTASCYSMVYVSRSVQSMYLSYESLLNLGLLPRTFPSINDDACQLQAPRACPAISAMGCHDGSPAPHDAHDVPCACPLRQVVPPRPTALPFPCTPANNERMKAWLLDRYGASTFNTCPHRALPCMEGPAVEIHVDPAAPPKACHTPANVPLHWQQKVYDDLLRDEALGVIERVPYGEPVTWCHRMVITRKHDGTPRRTVDLSPLNKFCQRETFAMESPFHLARRIPKNTWKTVTDAWNGYHSVPLRETDRHLTTFITPFGRWRYMRAPQGFLSSGDGYNRRFDAILSSMERKERCVDDTIHYDTELEQHWWRTIDFLSRVGQAGVVLNSAKFQFAERRVNFAGFRVSDETIEPLPKYLDAIRDFPQPASTTDIRSWFGLVNQVSNYAQLRDVMAPFKPFLSARCQFLWSPELEIAFQASKKAIVEAIRQGVEIFDLQRRTCLRPDWSKRGVGYFLLQQHCSCPSGLPDCCPNGWRITLAGSRFLSSAEQRYAAIEGEALAVAWGLEQTRYFTQGCDNLVVITDHKPLVKIFGDRTLDEITNSRLFRLKQRTLPWRFDIQHMPGHSNQAADATSRHPSPSGSVDSTFLGTLSVPDLAESALMAAICSDTQALGAISWPLIAHETAADTSLSHLLQLTEQGGLHKDDPALGNLRPICDAVYAQDGVLLYQDRVVVPQTLRRRVLQHLHAAHQGISTMEQRARAIVFWPGMSKDIRDTRAGCTDCNRNAPSQAAPPPLPSQPPSTPFEGVFADFFDYGGRHYLVVGDRLSGWAEVLSSTAGTSLGGSAGLVRHLRTFFSTFGVPAELSSDGGPEFIATSTEEFLRRWGVKHRISSVSFPQSNGRAEVAVKTAKRLLMSNTGPTGSLDHDRFLRAMLQLRNTPDPDCNLSPAQIVFGRPLRDSLAFVNRLEKYTNPNIRPLWRNAWAAKENALRARFTRTTESLKEHSRSLRPLSLGETVFLQNQSGLHPTKWDRSGVVVESLGYDQYRVKVDGSGRLTLRNRRFLRAYSQATPSITPRPPQLSAPTAAAPDSLPPRMPLERPAPCDHPPHPAGPLPIQLPSASSDTLTDPPTSPPQSPQPQSPPLLPQPTPRPPRVRRPPKHYEPETGQWLE